MEQGRDILDFYNYNDWPLVEFAVERANLNRLERESLRLRRREKFTVEEAAELLRTSESTIKRNSDSGLIKLNSCWSGVPWINTILVYDDMFKERENRTRNLRNRYNSYDYSLRH